VKVLCGAEQNRLLHQDDQAEGHEGHSHLHKEGEERHPNQAIVNVFNRHVEKCRKNNCFSALHLFFLINSSQNIDIARTSAQISYVSSVAY